MKAEDIRQMRDIWPVVAKEVPEAMRMAHSALDDVLFHENIMHSLESKFRKGEAEHGRGWLKDDTDPSWLLLEAAEEILDFVLYQAMFIVLTDAHAEERTE